MLNEKGQTQMYECMDVRLKDKAELIYVIQVSMAVPCSGVCGGEYWWEVHERNTLYLEPDSATIAAMPGTCMGWAPVRAVTGTIPAIFAASSGCHDARC